MQTTWSHAEPRGHHEGFHKRKETANNNKTQGGNKI